MIKDLFNFSWKNMKHRQLRSWLTIVGVVIGIAAIVSLMTIGQGFENVIIEQFSAFGADRIRVTPEGLTGPPIGAQALTEDDVETVQKTLGIDFVSGIIFSTTSMKYNKQDYIAYVKGLDPEMAQKDQIDTNIEILEGEWFQKGASKVAVIGQGLAEDVFDKEIRVKNSITIQGEEYKVIGIYKKTGEQTADRIIYIPKDDAKELFGIDDGVSFIYAGVEEGKDINEVAEKVQSNLERDKGNDNFNVFTPEQLMAQLGTILSVVQFILAGIAAISLFVGGIGIMNTMYTSVLERTREIGAMKALGASGKQILTIFMIEAGLIGLAGGLIGVILGNAFAYLVQIVAALAGYDYLSISILWGVITFALAFAFIVGMLSGLYPAYRASKLNPVDALRYE